MKTKPIGRRLKRLQLVGQSLVLMAIAAVTLVGMSALAVDSSGAWRLGSKSEQTLELAKDASMTSLNATKFSQDPGQTTVDMVLDQMRQDGYVGDYTIWWYELGPSQTGTSDRLAGVEVQLDQTYETTVASVLGYSDMDVWRNKIWTLNPYSSTAVWRPDRAQSSYGEVWRGHMGDDGSTSSTSTDSATYGDLSHDLQQALQGGLDDLHGGGHDWRPPSYLEGTVSVSGDAVVNGTLTGSVEGIPNDATIAYNWYVSDNADGSSAVKVSGESSDTVTLRPEWVGKTMVCEAWDASGAHLGTITSDPAGPVRPAETSGTLSVNGGWAMGDRLATNLSGTPSGFRAAYQWRRDGRDIEGATGDSYQLSPEDVGHEVECVVTDASGAYSGEITSEPHTVDKAKGKVGVSVSGDTMTGGTVTAALGGIPSLGDTDVTWRWQRSDSASGPWSDISGATSDEYSPTSADSGKWIRAVGDATNPYYELGEATSDAFGPIEGRPLAGVASLDGSATVSSTLTIRVTGAQSDAKLRYQWFRDGVTIDGADGSTYVATKDDLGHMISCQVSDTSGRYAGNLVAGPVGPIEKTRWANLTARLDGEPTVGSTAMVSVSGLPDGDNTVHYKWTKSKDGVTSAVGDESSAELPITSDLNGYTLSCGVSVDNDAYDVVGVNLGPLGPITGQPLVGTVIVSGSATYGQKLTCTVDGAPADAQLSYQWSIPDYDSGMGVIYKPIEGKTSSELLCDLNLVGSEVTCVVTDASGKYVGQLVADSVTIGKATTVAPSLRVTGAAKVGSTLTVTTSGLPKVPETKTTFTWQVADAAGGPWADISGASSDSLALGRDLLGKYVRCGISFDNAGYVIPDTTSKVMGPVQKGAMTGTVSVSADASADGTVLAGAKLTASVSGLPDGATASYRWSRDGAYIDGATGSTYTSTDEDAGKTIVCHVTDGSGVFAGEIVSAGVAIKSKDPVAFAVFSADDNSLRFYKRTEVPKAGEQFDGRTATNVYEGVEDTSNGVPWSGISNVVTSATVMDEGITPVRMNSWFSGFGKLETADLSKLDTSKTTSMNHLFYKWGSLSKTLKSINLTGLNTSSVIDMSGMFQGNAGLVSLDLSSFDTSKVSDMSCMFNFCSGLISLDVTGFDTSCATNLRAMFQDCKNLTSLDVTNFDTSMVTDMSSMFASCKNLTSLDITNFNTSMVTSTYGMFSGCSNLASLDVTNFNTANVTNMSGMFNGCSNLASLDVTNFNTANVTNMSYMFDDCSSLTFLNLTGFDTSKVCDMSCMFNFCSKLASLDVTNFNTANVTNMSLMFQHCSILKSLNVTSFDTSQATSMYGMFNGCSNLTSLDLSSFDTSRVTNMGRMFNFCSRLTSLDLSSFDTSMVTDMSSMFDSCKTLVTDCSKWNVSKVTNYSNFSYNAPGITEPNWV